MGSSAPIEKEAEKEKRMGSRAPGEKEAECVRALDERRLQEGQQMRVHARVQRGQGARLPLLSAAWRVLEGRQLSLQAPQA